MLASNMMDALPTLPLIPKLKVSISSSMQAYLASYPHIHMFGFSMRFSLSEAYTIVLDLRQYASVPAEGTHAPPLTLLHHALARTIDPVCELCSDKSSIWHSPSRSNPHATKHTWIYI